MLLKKFISKTQNYLKSRVDYYNRFEDQSAIYYDVKRKIKNSYPLLGNIKDSYFEVKLESSDDNLGINHFLISFSDEFLDAIGEVYPECYI